jgi:hypothetical protein
MSRWFKGVSLNSIKKGLVFGVTLLLLEVLLLIALASLDNWVVKSLCPSDFQASGHCYADWVDWYERSFFCLVLTLLSSSALCWPVYFFRPLPDSTVKRISLLLMALLVLFVILMEFHFVGEVVLTMILLKGLEHYFLSRYSNVL